MTLPDRRARHRASLRQEILAAASKLLVEEGYERVTMRRIAASIEYSPTTIYLHFKDKDELVLAICEETFAQLAAKVEVLKAAPGAPLTRLREVLRAYIEFGLKHPSHYAVTFLQAQKTKRKRQFEGSIAARAFGALRECVAACVKNGDISTGSVDTTAQLLWASIHGLTALLITDKGFPLVPRQALVDHTLDTLIAGLKTPAPAPPRPRPPQQSKPFSFMD